MLKNRADLHEWPGQLVRQPLQVKDGEGGDPIPEALFAKGQQTNLVRSAGEREPADPRQKQGPPRQTSRDRRGPAPTQKEVDPQCAHERDPDVSGQDAGRQEGPEDDPGNDTTATTGTYRC